MANKDVSVVLAHGAWADGSSWARVITALDADGIRIPLRTLVAVAEAMVATIVVSCIWPLLSGSPATRVFYGVFVQPLGQADHLVILPQTDILWLPIVLIFMLLLINRRDLMGDYVNTSTFNVVAWVTAVAVIALTLVLVYVTIVHPSGVPGAG